MAANPWKKYNSFPFRMAGKHIDFSGDTFKMALFTSAGNASNPTQTTYGSLTGELPTANGYTVGGVTLTGVSLTQATATVTWATGNATWTASGGSLVFRYAVIYDSTTGDVICWALLDNTPADITVTSGNSFTVQINTLGVYTITGM
jgi:hypothetical protein